VSLLLKRKANPGATNKRGQGLLELSKPEVRRPRGTHMGPPDALHTQSQTWPPLVCKQAAA